MNEFWNTIFEVRSDEFELTTAGLAIAALFIGPMWMDYLHNNKPARSQKFQLGIGLVCTATAIAIFIRLLTVFWDK